MVQKHKDTHRKHVNNTLRKHDNKPLVHVLRHNTNNKKVGMGHGEKAKMKHNKKYKGRSEYAGRCPMCLQKKTCHEDQACMIKRGIYRGNDYGME